MVEEDAETGKAGRKQLEHINTMDIYSGDI